MLYDYYNMPPAAYAIAWPAPGAPSLARRIRALVEGLDPETHLKLGRALAPLRHEDVLIVGSGMSYHNQRGLMSVAGNEGAAAFDRWLRATLEPRSERDRRLLAWRDAPFAAAVHPREEHLLPLMVVAGAAGDDPGSVPFTGKVFGKPVSAVQFG